MQDKKSLKRNFTEMNDSPTIALRLLIVEDNLLNQKIIKNLLKEYSLIISNNGQEAIELVQAALNSLETQVFDLILMDIEMPVKNGIEATKEICALDNAPPIIGISSADETLKNQALAAGMKTCYSKPYQKQQLLNGIKYYTAPNLMNKKRAIGNEPLNRLTFFSSIEGPASKIEPTNQAAFSSLTAINIF